MSSNPIEPQEPSPIDGWEDIPPEEDSSTLPLPAAFSEEKLTLEWVKRNGKNWRYVAELDRWYRWTGKTWEQERKRGHYHTARNLCREAMMWPGAQELSVSAHRQLGKASTAAAVITNLRNQPEIALHPEDLDSNPMLLATPDGVVDLQSGKLIEAYREAYCTKCTLVSPRKAAYPLWQAIIDRAARGDDSMSSYLKRWAGYLLTGDTREECFMFVHGPGGSGKSTFVRVLSEILGTYSRACNMDAFTNRERAEHSTEIAKLSGARMVTATETDAGSKWNEPRIKQLTGRDKIAARFMRQDEFEFMPSFKIVIAGNHRPGLKTIGEEMRRRVHLIEFPDTIPEEDRDKQLPLKLQAEYPAILSWMIEGCLEWIDCGLGKPERVAEDTHAYLESLDVMGAWIDEFLEPLVGASVKVSECHKSYCAFAKDRGEYEPSMTRFSEDMQARGYETFKSSTMHFRNHRLKSPVTQVSDYSRKYD